MISCVPLVVGRLSVGQKRAYPRPLRLFALDELGEGGWLKAMRLEGYAPMALRGPSLLQPALFPYAEAL